MPAHAHARSPTPDTSNDDIQPLGLESEGEVLAVLTRLRDQLAQRITSDLKQAKHTNPALNTQVNSLVLSVSTLS